MADTSNAHIKQSLNCFTASNKPHRNQQTQDKSCAKHSRPVALSTFRGLPF